MNKTIRLTRIIVSIAIFGVLTCGLTCSALMLPVVGKFLEKIQIGQAVMAFSMVIFIAWLIVTLFFGRVYCSSVCPMGTLMDISARSVRRRPLEKFHDMKQRYRYAAPYSKVRYAFLAVTLLSVIGGLMILPSVIDPFSAFNRICTALFRPAVSLMSSIVGAPGAVLVTASIMSTVTAIMILAITAVASVKSGRALCNTVCPIGTALGCISRFSIYQMDIDTDLCIHCGLCEDVCKSGCINLKDFTVDGSRCVVCFDCAAVCPNSAIRFTRQRKQLATPMMQRLQELGRNPQTTLDASNSSLTKPTSSK